MFLRWSVQKKLIACFSFVLLLMCILGSVAVNRMNAMKQNTETITTEWMPGVEAVNRMTYLMEHVVTLTFRHIHAEDESQQDYVAGEIQSTYASIDELFVSYEAMADDPEERESFEKLKQYWAIFKTDNQSILENSAKGAEYNTLARKTLIEKLTQFITLQSYLDQLVVYNHNGAIHSERDAADAFETALRFTIGMIVISVILASVLAFVITRMLSAPLKKVTSAIARVAKGDLAVEPLAIANKDEIGDLAAATNEMVQRLRELVSHVAKTAHQVAASSAELSSNAETTATMVTQAVGVVQTMAESALTQHRGAEDSSRAMEEMSRGIQRIAGATTDAADASSRTDNMVKKGDVLVRDAVAHMDAIHAAVGSMAAEIRKMETCSAEIQQFIGVISGIAQQTNLLSLNASIEAARAGEHGLGFAVVATEVKKLSAQSEAAAMQVSELVNEIQRITLAAAGAMENGVSQVETGMSSVHETGRTFAEIALAVNHVDEQIQEISAIAEQLSAGSQEVAATAISAAELAQHTSSLAQVLASGTDEQSAAIEEVSASAIILSEAAKELEALVRRFTL
ncbi:methyl-accepting chemotaxis protein [Paenibacillus antri]|uniref:Methyl-accepting chemotaxis protein n=1 Tax=Paenibacillus antri TaxID=2582848 RepID=A0A5R9GLM4_9BACL|nr:methyl-accepting chemotaxis protein [Paenibacillus antri]TLS52725.1 methyl-accepting chemotaxis protein [Paenibacillus antri]